jgi:hypothetical protein
MSTVRVNVEWNQGGERSVSHLIPLANAQALEQKQRPLVRKIVAGAQALKCPHCEAIIYSRRSKICGVCSRDLPLEFHFTAKEAARLDKIIESERSRHRKWMTRTFNQGIAVPHFE